MPTVNSPASRHIHIYTINFYFIDAVTYKQHIQRIMSKKPQCITTRLILNEGKQNSSKASLTGDSKRGSKPNLKCSLFYSRI
ncbi:hypothetical protein EUGRSUZ_C01560 [Eucalyptus grandis]|uniref:Uncharacterized protein n=2 Tax=Eucalyptus grandis TaxID=71139 RepID=A0ACC3LDJ7_EUCGR|nr:hypothetical protein EUGRSUZ_C01560 [Eucalyptus grandis]